jgi:hypothetical protein
MGWVGGAMVNVRVCVLRSVIWVRDRGECGNGDCGSDRDVLRRQAEGLN